MILVLAFLPVLSLTQVVCVLVVMWGCALYVCESLKLESGTVMVMVLRQYFKLSNCGGPVTLAVEV